MEALDEAAKFGALVRATRKARRLPLGELAERADTGVKHLGRIERGEKKPSFDLVIDLARAMNVSPSIFFDFDGLQPDMKALRTTIRQLLDEQDPHDLVRIMRVLRAILT